MFNESETVPRPRSNELLGSFEFNVLNSIRTLGNTAYGAEIGRHLSGQLRRTVTAPQVYMTLSRLKKRGFVSSEETIPVPQRGGRSRIRFKLEAGGVRALVETSAAYAASRKEAQHVTGAASPT